MTEDSVALILSGGIGLGAYQAGAYAALIERSLLRPKWIAGSSIGAVNAAVIAGNPEHGRLGGLRELWKHDGQAAESVDGASAFQRWRHVESWSSAIRTRLIGSRGSFHPRVPIPWEPFKSLYDLAPLKKRITRLVDFDRLNGGETRLTVAATDIETGELLFDTARGDRIGIDHLLASCGYLPEFAPVEIGGRLLGDGGLAANAPVEALRGRPDGALTCFVLDLFARDGSRPTDLETAMARKSDIMFANQTWQRLEAYCREQELRCQLDKASQNRTRIYYLSYRPDSFEAGAERVFDYSNRSIATRWTAGEADMVEALLDAQLAQDADVMLIAVRRRRSDEQPAHSYQMRRIA